MQKTAAPPQIAILAAGFIEWTGGVDFLGLCIAGMDSALPGITWPVLVPRDTAAQRALALAVATKRRLFSLAGARPAVVPPVSTEHLRDTVATTGCRIDTHTYYGSPHGLDSTMRSLGVEVVLPCATSLGPHFPHRWIGYLPDLQHKQLPGNFSRRERWTRDRKYSALLADAPGLIVNSKSVVSDIERFYPDRKSSLFSLPFCPMARQAQMNSVGDEELRPYGMPKKFFMISNQFWVHKSHQTAFDALRLISDAGFADVHIVCTGNVDDYRAPGHIHKLKQGISNNGLTDRIHFLGIIPKLHQLALMRRSVAVVQPTLFEGGPGGGALCDGICTSTPVILSDIEVNREADLGVIDYFRAGSAEDLAQKMMAVLRNPPERLSAEATLSMLEKRQQQLGETFSRIISFVAAG